MTTPWRSCSPRGISSSWGSPPCSATSGWRTQRTTRCASWRWPGSTCRWRAGCDEALVEPPTDAAAVHGATGMDGAELPPPVAEPLPVHAVEFLIEQARAHQGELVLAITGAHTNVALALRLEPRLAPLAARDHDHGRQRRRRQRPADGLHQRRLRPRGGADRVRERRADPLGRLRADPDRAGARTATSRGCGRAGARSRARLPICAASIATGSAR